MSEYYKMVRVGGRRDKTAFYFNSIADVLQFNDEILSSIPTGSEEYKIARPYIQDIIGTVQRRSNKLTWYGTNDTSWAGKKINEYLKINQMQEALNSLASQTVNLEIEDLQQKQTLIFNDRELGIFSFDLASLGLIPVYEYYSNLLKRIVDANFVESYVNDSGDIIYYFVGLPYVPKHQLEYSIDFAGYYSKILGRVVGRNEIVEEIPTDPNKEILYFFPERNEIPKHDVEQRQSVDESGEFKFTSTYKKSFIQIEKVQKSIPRVDLIIPTGYAGTVMPDEMFWNSVSISAISRKLSELNIDYRIIASRAIQTYTGNKRNYGFINLKSDYEVFDMNQLSVIISDARFFRIDLFRLAYAMQYLSGYGGNFSDEIGYSIREQSEIKSVYMDYLSQQTNESDLEASKNPVSKIVIESALSRAAAISSYNNVIQQIRQLVTV